MQLRQRPGPLGRFDEAVAHYRQALEIQPGVDGARRNLAFALADRERIVRTLALKREALHSRPHDAALLNDIAWMLATNPDASVRNAAEAVELAQRALTSSGGNDPAILNTLAAAYAARPVFGSGAGRRASGPHGRRAGGFGAGRANPCPVGTVPPRKALSATAGTMKAATH